jgi:hypothetical protein
MDDGLACCFSPKKLEALIAYMESYFAMLLNPLSTYIYVGLHIHWNEDDGHIFNPPRCFFTLYVDVFWF